MLSISEQYLYSIFKNWLTFYLINNFIYLIKFYHLNLTYNHAITIQKPTFIKQTFTKYTKRQLNIQFKDKFKTNNQLLTFLNITNTIFLWFKPLNYKTIITNIYGLLTLNQYLIKPSNWHTFQTTYKTLFTFFFTNFLTWIWFTNYNLTFKLN